MNTTTYDSTIQWFIRWQKLYPTIFCVLTFCKKNGKMLTKFLYAMFNSETRLTLSRNTFQGFAKAQIFNTVFIAFACLLSNSLSYIHCLKVNKSQEVTCQKVSFCFSLYVLLKAK